MTVKKTQLPSDSRLHESYRPGDFLDCYTVAIAPPDRPLSEILQYVLIEMPGWARMLLRIRDSIVGLFGIRTSQDFPQDNSFRRILAVGDPVGFMQVRHIAGNEIILGEDDSHLDFRVTIYRAPGEAGLVSLATLVHRHNWIGRLYLALIMPFHILIVKSRLAAAARHFALNG
tara:strand:- start:5931 stop:6449 length:519 start_codon:yes stop_codon:yes gene_type:complete